MEVWWAEADPLKAKAGAAASDIPASASAPASGSGGVPAVGINVATPKDDGYGGWLIESTEFKLLEDSLMELCGLDLSSKAAIEKLVLKAANNLAVSFAPVSKSAASKKRKAAETLAPEDNKKQKPGEDGSAVRLKRPDTSLDNQKIDFTDLFANDPSGVRLGTVVDFSAVPAWQSPISWELRRTINDALRSKVFWLQKDKNAVVLGALPNDSDLNEQKGAVILRHMRLLSLESMETIASDSYAAIVTSDGSSSSSGGYTTRQALGLWNDQGIKDRQESDYVKQFNCLAYGSGSRLWIPARIPLVLWEVGREAKLFGMDGQGWTGTRVSTSATALYGVDNTGGLKGVQVILPGTGNGGGGEMRSDIPDEADYVWISADVWLAAAVGLDPKMRVFGPPGAAYVEIPTPFTGFQYFKAWKHDDGSGKKNAPFLTYPLAPRLKPANKVEEARTNFLREISIAETLRKKRKGEWNNRNGVVLKGRNAAKRRSANDVMKKAFDEFGQKIDGSATKLVEQYLPPPTDPEDLVLSQLADAWKTFSKDLTARTGVAVAPWRPLLRTDQEWCHLYGHGDGGNEVLENFVAGAEHANTEQLAIETAQRSWPGDLVAKITAYLLPSDGIDSKIIRDVDRDFLESIGWPNASTLTFETFETALTPFPELNDLEKRLADLGVGWPNQMDQDDGHKTSKLSASTVRGELLSILRRPLPIASLVRYKIYLKATDQYPARKVFDHLIEMQRESFDLFQFRLLYWAVKIAISRGFDERNADLVAAKADTVIFSQYASVCRAIDEKAVNTAFSIANYGTEQARASMRASSRAMPTIVDMGND